MTDIPDPDPVAERAAMKVHELAEVNLFASDPDFTKPIQINFDSSGALWIASSEVYPQIRPGEFANDKIIVVRDSDGDGVADQRTVFADGLLIPTGVIPDGPNAAYVAESTRLLYLTDTDGDGKADHRRIVLSGFGTEDTHHLIHTLRFGPDGCLYFNQSIYIHSHIQTPYGTRHLDGGGIWRYRPSDGHLEVVCKGFVNPWGHVFDAVGESFVTDGAFFEGINYVFPDSVFVASPGATRWLKGMNPGSPKHCGLEILSGTHVPESWQGELITNDFRGHRVCRFKIRPDGSGYTSRQQPELMTSRHVAFRPIDVCMGPDGAIYIADWYNPIIQHGEVDFRDPRRDREHGRIWRVSFPGRELDPWPDFTKLDVDDLLALLADPSLRVRQLARQQLWRNATDAPEAVIGRTRAWAGKQTDSGKLELAWLQEVVGDESSDNILRVENMPPAEQRTYLRSLWRRRLRLADQPRRDLESAVTRLASSDDPRVRLEAVIAAGQLDADQHPDALLRVIEASKQPVDQNLDFAIWQSIRKLDASYNGGSILTVHDWANTPNDLALAVAAIGQPSAAEVAAEWLESSGDAPLKLVKAVALSADGKQLGRVVRSLARRPDSSITELKPILERTKRDGTVPADVGNVLAKTSARWLKDPTALEELASMIGAWQVAELEPVLLEAIGHHVGDAQARAIRSRVIQALGAFDTEAARSTLQSLASKGDPDVRVSATGAIAARQPMAAVKMIVDLLIDESTGDSAIELFAGQLGRKELPERFASVLAGRSLSGDRARAMLQRVQRAGGNETLEEAIRVAGKLGAKAWAYTPELREEILKLVRDVGDAERGQRIYRRENLQCIQCHAIGVGGGLVGPNLISLGGSSQPDYIIESLLDPNAKLKEGYTTLNLLTVDGVVLNGIVIGRTESSVNLRLADGKEIQVASEAIEFEKPGKSLMPEGLLDSLSKAELVDLTTFLIAIGRDPEFTVSTEPIVREFETLRLNEDASLHLNRVGVDAVATDHPELKWRTITTLVDGRLPLMELDRFRPRPDSRPTSFVRFQINVTEKRVVQLSMPTLGASTWKGVLVWVDGQPATTSRLASLELSEGEHTIVLAIDRDAVVPPFRVFSVSE